jgi:hypothetical protein
MILIDSRAGSYESDNGCQAFIKGREFLNQLSYL